ncbi:MAG: DUF2069 domain-containing protein [Cellvibrionales bacterium]|nr:DUF2069 domain-containing protein [Cellvibrionales bacterium]
MTTQSYATLAKSAAIINGIGIALFVLTLMAGTLWFPPTHKSPNWVICVLVILPIALLLPWLIKGSPRAHIWFCFILLGYFLNSVQSAFLVEYGVIPWIELPLEVLLFISSMLFARWQFRAHKTAQ